MVSSYFNIYTRLYYNIALHSTWGHEQPFENRCAKWMLSASVSATDMAARRMGRGAKWLVGRFTEGGEGHQLWHICRLFVTRYARTLTAVENTWGKHLPVFVADYLGYFLLFRINRVASQCQAVPQYRRGIYTYGRREFHFTSPVFASLQWMEDNH